VEYQLILSEDANFKMKGRLTSTREKDPTLGPGFAYMVANDGYLEHLAKYVDQDEVGNNPKNTDTG
jgi:cephalosporin hydroxylase